MVPIITNDTIDSILNTYRSELGENYASYRNHVYRVYNFALTQLDPNQELEKLSIATAFHDLGIWTNKTLDYLEPSVQLAREYCKKQNISFSDTNEVEMMINNHHKLSAVESSVLAEIFREADLIDLTFGLVPKGRKKEDIYSHKFFLINLINTKQDIIEIRTNPSTKRNIINIYSLVLY